MGSKRLLIPWQARLSSDGNFTLLTQAKHIGPWQKSLLSPKLLPHLNPELLHLDN
jgi:hypothetical protein